MDEFMQPQEEDDLKTLEITQSGMTVVIETSRHDCGGWSLSVYGKEGQKSEWLETFSCSEEAVAAACTAIRYEGIEEFYDDPALRSDDPKCQLG